MIRIRTLFRLFNGDKEKIRLRLFSAFSRRGLLDFLSDKTYLKLKYWCAFGKSLNLKNPQTYNEKLQWLKLYDRKPLYTKLVDKVTVKDYVAQIIGKDYIIPTLGIWDSFDEIDFDSLPSQFVLKANHSGNSEGVVICKNKDSFDKEKAKMILGQALATDYYKDGREWPYKDVTRKIFAEEYLEDNDTRELRDYKFFCMNGVCRALFIATDRQKEGEEVKFDFYDSDFNHLDLIHGHANAEHKPQKPETFERMKQLAEAISKGLPEARCDFYEVNGHNYFGEITFFHHGGFVPFKPERWDQVFGDWIILPPKP